MADWLSAIGPQRRQALGALVGGWRPRAASVYRRVVRALKPRGPQVTWRDVGDLTPQQVRDDNFRLVAQSLDTAGIDWWYVTGLALGHHVIGVSVADRTQVMAALSSASMAAAYVRDLAAPQVPVPAAQAGVAPALANAEVLQVGVPSRARQLLDDLDHGCEIEFWTLGDRVLAPRTNRAAMELSPADMAPVETVIAGRSAIIPAVFTRRMLDDITFDIDVVYTWVDGGDPEWLALRNRTLADLSGVPYHPEAVSPARFRSRDELRYSLRSIAMYAPWVRRIFLVTNGQVPEWLSKDNGRIEVVAHDAIFDDPGHLPTFNSNAIISRLHHLPGLSEHYLYFNDDVFLARPASPDDFFTPSGLAKVFPANNRRPFGAPNPEDEPHFNLTRNIRALLEREFRHHHLKSDLAHTARTTQKRPPRTRGALRWGVPQNLGEPVPPPRRHRRGPVAPLLRPDHWARGGRQLPLRIHQHRGRGVPPPDAEPPRQAPVQGLLPERCAPGPTVPLER